MTLTELRDVRVGWGTQPRMNAFETIMWRADPIVRSPVLAVELLATVPDWGRLRAIHAWAVRTFPRLRERVVEPLWGLGAPAWGEDLDFDLSAHLHRVHPSEGAQWSDVLAFAAQWALQPLDRGRPPWEAVLYTGLPDGRAAYLIKVHHSLTDGLGAAQLLEQLHSREPEAPPPLDSEPCPAARTSELGALAGQLREDLASASDALAAVGGGAVGALRDPVAWLGSVGRFAGSLRRSLTGPDAHASPLLAERGESWRFAAIDVPLAELRAAAKVAGATLHDAYLAALLGGYRIYHAALGTSVATIPMAVPISRRRPGEPGGGNRFAGARFAGPADVADPLERIRAVRELVLAARAEPALDSLDLLAPALGRLPGSVLARLMEPMTAGNDLQASFVPGARAERYLGGARVERIYPFAPLPGCPAMITMVTHRDTGCVGVNLDPAAVTRPELFVDCVRAGFAEVLALRADPPAKATGRAPAPRVSGRVGSPTPAVPGRAGPPAPRASGRGGPPAPRVSG